MINQTHKVDIYFIVKEDYFNFNVGLEDEKVHIRDYNKNLNESKVNVIEDDSNKKDSVHQVFHFIPDDGIKKKLDENIFMSKKENLKEQDI